MRLILILSLALISSVSGQMRRVVRKISGDRKGGGGFKRLKKVKIPSSHSFNEPAPHEAASERLLNPFNLFNLVRFPNTQCTTNRG